MQIEVANPYDSEFYAGQKGQSYTSAKAILQFVWNHYRPASVVDVGCGMGTWLKAASELGVHDFLGLEGDWLQPDQVEVPWKHFQTCDLKNPPSLKRTFDFAMSMEVAEHLPESNAKSFVSFLTGLAPVILFSAAIPNQTGTGHLNEQWPAYWAGLFREKNFVAIDAVRQPMWNRPEVAWWYAQNTILYVERAFLEKNASLQHLRRAAIACDQSMPLSLVHPFRFETPQGIVELLGLMPKAVGSAVQRRVSSVRAVA